MQFSKYIRLRDCVATTGSQLQGKCCSCGRVKEFKQLHAGHFIGGRRAANLFDTRGCHAQCVRCNTFEQGNWPGYFAYMERVYGRDVINELMEQDKQIKTWTVSELTEIRDKYKAKVKEMT